MLHPMLFLKVETLRRPEVAERAEVSRLSRCALEEESMHCDALLIALHKSDGRYMAIVLSDSMHTV